MRRFASKTVLVGLEWNAFFAESPILVTEYLDVRVEEQRKTRTVVPHL